MNKKTIELSDEDRSAVRRELLTRAKDDSSAARIHRRFARESVALALERSAMRIRELAALFAVLLLGCADLAELEAASRAVHALQLQPGQALPRDVFFEADVPECDRGPWRLAAAAWNQEVSGPDVLVLHEEPGAGRCGVYIAPGEPGWTVEGCVERLAYDPCELACFAGHQLGHALGLPDETGEVPRSVMHPRCVFGLPNRFNGVAMRALRGPP